MEYHAFAHIVSKGEIPDSKGEIPDFKVLYLHFQKYVFVEISCE